MFKNTAIILKSEDWEGLYIDKVLIEEGHNIEEGNDRAVVFANLAKVYEFDLSEMKEVWADSELEELVQEQGNMPSEFPMRLLLKGEN